jgi:hypothetical protein
MYAMDMPRGARIVRDGIIIEDLKLLTEGKSENEPAGVYVTGDDGCTRIYALHEILLIDEDTPQRRARLAFAQDILSNGP